MKYNYFNYNTNKYNFYSPFCPLGSIYNMSGIQNNIISNNKEKNQKNKKKYSDSFKNENSLDLYQESNSMSHLSTTSEGDQGINNNFNNFYFFQSNQESKKANKNNKNKNLHESIIMGIKDISDCFNSNKNESNVISFSCYYFCDIHMNNEKEFFLDVKIKQLIDDYKKNINKP